MSVFDEVIADLRGRDALGASQHGGREMEAMEPGRDWLQEAYEEALDQAVYLKALSLRLAPLLAAAEAFDRYAGAAGEVEVSALGSIATPVRLFQEMRAARRGVR